MDAGVGLAVDHLHKTIKELREELAQRAPVANGGKPCRNQIINSGAHVWPRSCQRCGIAKCPDGVAPNFAAAPAPIADEVAGEVLSIIPDWPYCNPGCDYEDPHGRHHDGRGRSCSCDAAKASMEKQLTAQSSKRADFESEMRALGYPEEMFKTFQAEDELAYYDKTANIAYEAWQLGARIAPDAPAGDLPPLPEQPQQLTAYWECEDCAGHGVVGELQSMGHFQPPEAATCSACDGKGRTKTEAFLPEQMRAYVLVDRAARAAAAPAGHAEPVAWRKGQYGYQPLFNAIADSVRSTRTINISVEAFEKAMLAAPVAAQPAAKKAVHIGDSLIERQLIVGKFYMVVITYCPDVDNDWELREMQARFAGCDDKGLKLWNFLDPDPREWPVTVLKMID